MAWAAVLLWFAVSGWFVLAGCIVISMIRERAPRGNRAASSLKQLGYGCRLYAHDHGGRFPPELVALFPRYISDSRVYLYHRMKQRLIEPRDGSEAPRDEGIAHCYVRGLRGDDAGDHVLAFTEEWNHDGEGVHVLYVASNVEWHRDIGGLHAQLEEQRKELADQGREMKIIRPSWSRWPERPEYPVTPLRERPLVIALVAGSGIAIAALAALLVVRRRRRARENRA